MDKNDDDNVVCHYWRKDEQPNSVFVRPENYDECVERGNTFNDFNNALSEILVTGMGFELTSFSISTIPGDDVLQAEIVFKEDGVVMAKLQGMLV